MTAALRWIFFALFVRPLTWIVLGVNVRNAARLPQTGPAIIVANHNSHLDTLVLMSLFPLRFLARLRPVAAADYFLRWRWLAWFALDIVGIIPIERRPTRGHDVLEPVVEALARGDVVILFPEGTRGEPETRQRFKTGIAHLLDRLADTESPPVTPIFLHGLGKALPRGEAILVPFFVDVFVGEPLTYSGDRKAFMEELESRMNELATDDELSIWE